MNKWKMDDKGFTLVEMIVILAIIAAIGGIVGFGLSMVSGKPVTQCARQMQILLEQNRTVAMGKENTYIVLYKTSDGIMAQEYINGSENGEPKRIGESVVDVTCGGTPLGSSLGTGVRIEFDRGTGALTGNTEMVFVISRGGKTATLTIEALTGKVRIQ